MHPLTSEAWLVILALFSAFMLILIEVQLYAIGDMLRQLRDHFISLDDEE